MTLLTVALVALVVGIIDAVLVVRALHSMPPPPAPLPRLVRLQIQGLEPTSDHDGTITVEGYMLGTQPVRNPGQDWGHYQLDRPKVLKSADETISLGSQVDVPERRVVFIETVMVDARDDS